MNFFRLGTQLNPNAGLIQPEGNTSTLLMDGEEVDPARLKVLPWPFSLSHERAEPLQPADFYEYPNLMSDRMIEALRDAGVDNLQLFDADITNDSTGEKLTGYRVVNVLGLVSAVDTNASKGRALAHKQFFEKLVIDPSRAGGRLMFRLAESLNDIIIAEPVARRLATGEFVDLRIEPLTSATR